MCIRDRPVQTIALLDSASNPALDIGSLVVSVSVDALGNPRDVDIPGVDNGGTVDAGAVELQVLIDAPTEELPGLVVTTTEDVEDATDGVTSLREAIEFANDLTVGDADDDGADNDTITFDASLSGQTITLASALPELTADATIDGDLDDLSLIHI